MISLEETATIKAHALINLGAQLCVYPIGLYKRVSEVNEHLSKNELFASDLEDLILLGDTLMDSPDVSDFVRLGILDLMIYLHMKIERFREIKKSCGHQLRMMRS